MSTLCFEEKCVSIKIKDGFEDIPDSLNCKNMLLHPKEYKCIGQIIERFPCQELNNKSDWNIVSS